MNRLLRRAQSLKGLSIVTTGAYLNVAMSAVTLPILLRSLGVESAGQFAIAMSVYFLASMVTDVGMSAYLLGQGGNVAQLAQIRGEFLRIRLIALLTITLIAACGATLGAWGWAIALAVLAGGISSLHDVWLLNACAKFSWASLSLLSGSVMYLGLVCTLVRWHPSIFTALSCNLVSSSGIITTSYLFVSKMQIGRDFKNPSSVNWTKNGLNGLTYRLVTSSYSLVLPLLIGNKTTLASLGCYSGADRLIRAVQVGTNAFATFATHKISQKPKAKQVLHQGVLATLSGAVIGMVTFAATPLLINTFLGPEFSPSIEPARILALLLPITCLSNFLITSLFIPSGRQHLALISSLLGATFLVAVIAINATSFNPSQIAWAAVGSEAVVAMTAIILAATALIKAKQ